MTSPAIHHYHPSDTGILVSRNKTIKTTTLDFCYVWTSDHSSTSPPHLFSTSTLEDLLGVLCWVI